MGRTPFNAVFPDLDFYLRTIACQNACPVRTDARGYIHAIAQGEYERAYLIARETNPFASTCGWVCGAPCEAACRRGAIEAPVAIRALKRFVNDRYGIYLGKESEPRRPTSWRWYRGDPGQRPLDNCDIPTSHRNLRKSRQSIGKKRARVAVVGAGPAGLTCAHDLALMGCAVTVYEATSVPGGMLRLGIPEYRLPRELLDLEIEAITTLGPTIEFETALGRDFLLMDLRREFEAVFLGIGTHASRRLNVEGERQDGVLHAVDFLLNVNLGGYSLDLGQSIIVIGGGNVAMDVARTAARLGQETVSGGDVELALDVARAARRLGGTREVHCLVVESREEMLADRYEVEEALAEGIEVHNNFAPVRILGDGRTASGIRTMDVTRAFDEQGRFNPELRLGTARDWPCDSVIVSIGQVGDLAWMREEDGLEQLPGGRLKVDTQTLMTTADGVFAGGDIAFGPRLIINAVADGQRAAMGIDAYLRGRPLHRVRRGTFTSIDPKSYARYAPQEGFPGIPRRQPPTLPVERRIGISCVEETYEAEEARRQAARCLICNLNPIFEGDLCILCNGCVDVCPMDCLKLVPSHHIAGDKSVAAFVKTHAGGDGTAMLFDPAHCIRCGLCARRCPTGAVVMHTLSFQESWKEEGAI